MSVRLDVSEPSKDGSEDPLGAVVLVCMLVRSLNDRRKNPQEAGNIHNFIGLAVRQIPQQG